MRYAPVHKWICSNPKTTTVIAVIVTAVVVLWSVVLSQKSVCNVDITSHTPATKTHDRGASVRYYRVGSTDRIATGVLAEAAAASETTFRVVPSKGEFPRFPAAGTAAASAGPNTWSPDDYFVVGNDDTAEMLRPVGLARNSTCIMKSKPPPPGVMFAAILASALLVVVVVISAVHVHRSRVHQSRVAALTT